MISIIAAMTKKRVIGIKHKLPWNIPEELKNFKRLTSGNTVIMGRKTFESIGRPLPNRNNIVVSRSMQASEGITVCGDLNEAVEKGKSFGKEIFIIGGASIYEQAIEFADKMYLSFVKKDVEGDAYFPEFNQDEWSVEKKEEHPEFELVVFVRKHI